MMRSKSYSPSSRPSPSVIVEGPRKRHQQEEAQAQAVAAHLGIQLDIVGRMVSRYDLAIAAQHAKNKEMDTKTISTQNEETSKEDARGTKIGLYDKAQQQIRIGIAT